MERFLGEGFRSVLEVEVSLSEGGGEIDCSPFRDPWTSDAVDFLRRDGCWGSELPIHLDWRCLLHQHTTRTRRIWGCRGRDGNYP